MDDQCAGEADPLAHATRQLARIGRLVPVEPDQVDRGKCTLANVCLGKAERLQAELNVFQHGQPGKKREGLKHHRNSGRRSDDRLAEICDSSCRGPCKSCD